MDDALEVNLGRARRLVAVPAAVCAGALAVVALLVTVVAGVPLLAPVSIVVAVGLFLATSAGIRAQAPAVVLAATGSHPVSDLDEPRLHNLVAGLCVGIGLQPPRLWVVEDATANALAVARSVDDADLVVTRGLLDRLSLVELEAVLAHELARIRRGDAIVGTLAGPVLGGGGRVVPASLVAPVTRAVIGRGEPIESWSDLAAVEITRYPPGLVAALERIAEGDPSGVPPTHPAVAHLWIHGARPGGRYGEALSRVYEAPPPVGQRIEVLEEL